MRLQGVGSCTKFPEHKLGAENSCINVLEQLTVCRMKKLLKHQEWVVENVLIFPTKK